ncbi:unnamed protein product [Parajaminaea phylloscopi]
MASNVQPIRLHSRVAVSRMGLGTVLFVGQTSFAAGLWVGVELDPGVAGGKNDGSVQGKRYFDTDPNRGVFVRSSQLEVLDQDLDGDGDQDDDDDDDGAIDYIDSDDQEATLGPASIIKPQQTPKRAAPAPAVRSTAPRPRSSQLPPPSTSSTRSSSPQKPVAASSRPTLVSRSSVASSASAASASGSRAPVAPSASIARRSMAAGMSGSPTKGGAATPMRPGNLRGSATATASTSGRISAASSIGSTTSVRRAGSSLAASRNASPVTPAATKHRPTIGNTLAGPSTRLAATSARPSTITRAQAPASAPRPSLRPSQSDDHQSAAARTVLRPTPRTRPSMGPVRTSAHADDDKQTPRLQPRPQRAPTESPNDSFGSADNQDGEPADSPSAAARRRLAAGRARLVQRRPSAGAPHSASSDVDAEPAVDDEDADEEDLLSLSMDRNDVPLARPGPQPSLPSSMSTSEASALKREVEELKVKNRLAEKRREEERLRLKEYEKWKEDNLEKLRMSEAATTKAQNLSTQLLASQTAEKELALEKEDLENRVDDLTEQLEMAALDREMAEEKAEAALADLQALKDANEELTLEVEVLREENALYEHGPVDENERTSAGWVQLEKQNERLKEALIRLRDATSEADHDHRRRISDLEKQLSALAELQDSRDSLASKLEASEAQLEDIKIQLDDALGAEEMLEELTERNLFLGEKIAEMATTIEDLEALKELNEELEEVHVETEKQLQEEVDFKDMVLRERSARIDTLEGNANECEGTFAQFRELVLNLQADIEALRTERDGLVEEGRNAQLSSQSREMLNLNMKLQSSALKSQARTIDAELAKLRTEQATRRLEMTRPYLPVPFAQAGDEDAVAGLLFFERMSTKAHLIKSVLESNNEIVQVLGALTTESSETATRSSEMQLLVPKVPDSILVVCQLRHSLAHFAAVCNSVAALLRLAPPGTFLKCGRLYREIQSAIEPRVDAFVEALRKEELQEADCGVEFKRFVRQFEEMSYALMVAQEEEISQLHEQQTASVGAVDHHVPSGDGDLAAKEVGSATLLDLDLDTLCAALSSALRVVGDARTGPLSEGLEWQLDGHTLEERFFEPLHRLLADVRATKQLAKKLLRRLTNLASNDEAVAMEAIGDLPSLGRLSSKLVAFAMTLQSSMSSQLDEMRVSHSPVSLNSMLAVIKDAGRELRMDDGSSAYEKEAVEGGAPGAGTDAWREALDATGYLAQTIQGLVSGATEQDKVIKISGVAPWLPRSAVVHAAAARNLEAEAQMLKLQDDLRDLYQQIKARDAALSEGAIKIERLQRQLDKTKGRDDAHEEAKARLAEARQQAKAYQEANEGLQTELDGLEKANEALRLRISSDATKSIDGGAAAAAAAALGHGHPRQGVMGVDGHEGGGGMLGAMPLGGALSTMPALHLDTDYLLGQVDAMRAAIKYLREENALLQSSDLRAELDSLPELRFTAKSAGSRGVESSDGADELMGLPCKRRAKGPAKSDLRSADGERKHLYSSLLHFAATTKVVKLCAPKVSVAAEGAAGVANDGDSRLAAQPPRVLRRGWQPMKSLPTAQYDAQCEAADKLAARYAKLRQRSERAVQGGSLASSHPPSAIRAPPTIAV